MGRDRNPNRAAAMQDYLDSGGTLKPADLAPRYNTTPSTIRKWKSIDKWDDALEAQRPKRARGGQPGNKNARGHGAPFGNTNALTHGAYAAVRWDKLTAEDREYLDNLPQDAGLLMWGEVVALLAKERDLVRRMEVYRGADPGTLYTDRVVELRFARKNSEDPAEDVDLPLDTAGMYTGMETVVKSTPDDRLEKLEAQWDKVHGRIGKLLAAMSGHALAMERMELEWRRHALAKQRATGEYNVDPETGEINDDPDLLDEDESLE